MEKMNDTEMMEKFFIPQGVITHGTDVENKKMFNKELLSYFETASSTIKQYVYANFEKLIGGMTGNDVSFFEDFQGIGSVQNVLFKTLSDFDVIFEKSSEGNISMRVHQRVEL